MFVLLISDLEKLMDDFFFYPYTEKGVFLQHFVTPACCSEYAWVLNVFINSLMIKFL